jgi:ABC-2 type transport system ATP-binding protein
MSAVAAEHLCKQYREFTAVDDVSFEVAQGEIVALLGPNGAGKTTTIEILEGFLAPTGGVVTVLGVDPRRGDRRWRSRIGFVLQSTSLDLQLTVREAIAAYAAVFPRPRPVSEVLDLIDLRDDADTRIGQLSGGQQRRVDLGLGIVGSPDLLFLDEPTTGLDPQSRARLWDEVRRLRDGGTTIFLTTHYLEEADALCDRLAIIDHGRIVAEGSPDELKRQVAGDVVTVGVTGGAQPALRAFEGAGFVREASAQEDGTVRLYVDRGETAMPAILRLLDDRALVLETITLTRPSLDDVFLRQTGRSLRETAA